MAKEKMKVTEEQLLKALNELEGAADEEVDEAEEVAQPVAKSKGKAKKAAPMPSKDEESDDDEESSDEESMDKAHTDASPGMPDDTKEANGGFKAQKGASEDSEHFETDADEVDPSKASMKSLVGSDDTLRKGFEVSAFLEALTDAQVEATDGIAKSVSEFQDEQRAFNAKVQKALTAIGNMMLSKSAADDADGEEPVVVRPRSIVRKSQVTERFEANEADAPQYSKSQTLDALTDLVIKGEVPSLVVSSFETSNFIEPAFIGQVNAKLKQMFG